MVPKMARFQGNGGLDIRFYVRNPEKARFGAQSHACAETKRLGGW